MKITEVMHFFAPQKSAPIFAGGETHTARLTKEFVSRGCEACLLGVVFGDFRAIEVRLKKECGSSLYSLVLE